MHLHPLSITMAGAAFPVSITLKRQWCKYSPDSGSVWSLNKMAIIVHTPLSNALSFEWK